MSAPQYDVMIELDALVGLVDDREVGLAVRTIIKHRDLAPGELPVALVGWLRSAVAARAALTDLVDVVQDPQITSLSDRRKRP